jgi:iron complex outermembrane receptor protein
VSSDPFSADRIEILRGPATLMYGSSAEGGVVNFISNRIPSIAASEPLSGRLDLRYGDAANEAVGRRQPGRRQRLLRLAPRRIQARR